MCDTAGCLTWIRNQTFANLKLPLVCTRKWRRAHLNRLDTLNFVNLDFVVKFLILRKIQFHYIGQHTTLADIIFINKWGFADPTSVPSHVCFQTFKQDNWHLDSSVLDVSCLFWWYLSCLFVSIFVFTFLNPAHNIILNSLSLVLIWCNIYNIIIMCNLYMIF